MTPSEFHASRKFVSTSFGDIAYVERGSGPAALFMHGAPLCGYQWRHALEALKDVRRCIAPDSLGLGYTKVKPGVAVTPDAQVPMFADLLDKLGVDTVDLIGNDSGGGLAQCFAAAYPQRVRSLTLTNCEIGDYKTEVGDQFMQSVHGGMFTQMMRTWMADPRGNMALWGAGYEHPEKLNPDDLKVCIEPLLSSPERTKQMETYLCSFDAKYTIDAARRLKEAQVPIAILWGLADTFFNVKDARWLRSEVSSVRMFEEIPGAMLFYPEDRPEHFTAALRKFWTTVPVSKQTAA